MRNDLIRPRILGHRKDGRPIYSLAGASPDDPSNAPDPAPADPPADPAPSDPKPDDSKTFTQADVERIIAGRLSKYSDYDDIKKQLGDIQAANQTDQEKAVAAARDEGRSEASAEFGKQLAREAFDNLAGRRNAEFDTTKALELIDLGRFVKDGELDREALKEAVENIVPEKADEKIPPFGGGPRKQADRPDPGPGLPRLRDAYAQSSK